MANLVPYINFVGKSQEAVTFYKSVFGGDAEVQEDSGRVSHFEFRAGDIYFMGADHDSNHAETSSAKGYSLVLNCDSEKQIRDFYAKLVVNGKDGFAPTDSGWGAIIAQCIDRFGISWLLNYDIAK